MTKKTEKRLRLALRYIKGHPDISPAILSEEWDITINEAIGICSQNLATMIVYEGVNSEKCFKLFEKEMFEKLLESK